MGGDVLVVADALEPLGLRCAVSAGERHAAAGRRRLIMLTTCSLSGPLRASVNCGAVAGLAISEDDLRAQAERQVRDAIVSISPEVGVVWRCTAQRLSRALELELAATDYSLVVIGSVGTRRSRRLARQLVRTAERHGSLTTVAEATATSIEAINAFVPPHPEPQGHVPVTVGRT